MKRVVITGMGLICPIGQTVTESWQALIKGVSGVGPITLFDTSDFPIQIAAEVKDFDPALRVGHKEARRQDRFELMANAAADEALEQSGLVISEANSYRVGQSIACAFGGLTSIADSVTKLNEEGPLRVDPFGLSRFMTTSSSISIKHNLRGPSFSPASACASGADGIGLAFQMIRAGIVDAMLAGGADTGGLTALAISIFHRMRAYSLRPEATPSPFSRERDGLIMGEGAAALVLESLDHARARGADILAELIGYGATSDAFHITAPREDGLASAKALELALADAHLAPDEVDAISAHGTGTSLNDAAETVAIKQAFGESAYNIPISAAKSMTGHMMGASGAAEAIFCVQSIREGILPPTINYQSKDPQCDLDYVPNTAREKKVRVAISNSFGFGGHNSVLVFRAFAG
jgi:beta-ketoacyl-acyl-carrier-protein synthase II